MKKRIFAASMASVMALSSVSVVAFADETKADFGEAVTKAELKEYVKSFEKFVEDKLEDYGTIQADKFEKALDAATNVVNDRNSTDDDVNAAYQMLKAVYESLTDYSAAQLKELIADCKADYETENVLNDAFGDEIWKAEGWEKFVDAYDRAEAYVDAEDKAEINDAYLELYDASQALAEKDSVSKSEFRKVYLQYTDIAEKLSDYEGWRRGTCSVNAKTGGLKNDDDKALSLVDAKFVTYAELENIVYGASSEKLWAKDTVDQGRGVATPSAATLTKTWIKLGEVDGASMTTVKEYVEAAYNYFLDNANSNKTTNDDILNAYKSAKEAVAVFNGWKADNVKGSSKVIVDDMLDAKRAKLLDAYYGNFLGSTITGLEMKDGKLTIKDAADLTAIKAMTINKKTKLITIDTNGMYKAGTVAGDVVTFETFFKDTLKKDLDLTKYIPLTSAGIQTGVAAVTSETAQDTALKKALEVYDLCVVEDAKDKDERNYKTAVNDIDDNATVGKKDRASKAYALVVRDVKYALDDKFVEPAAAKTLDELSEICKKARDLVDETGDAFLFRTENDDLAKARTTALEWLGIAKADKDYDNSKYDVGTLTGQSSDNMYNLVNDAYKALSDKAAKYKYSYGDVAELIATVSEGLEADAYGASTASIKAAVSDLAYSLMTLDSDGEENEAFDDDANFIAYNRVNSDGNKADKALHAKYEALIKAVEDAGKTDVTKGDIDGDGVVSALDALAALKSTVGKVTLTDAQKAAADVDGDGEVTVLDALAILKSTVSQG